MPTRRACLVLVALAAAAPARAQISPGPLARPHEQLEGSRQCLKCHDSKGVSPERCLACHTLLRDRIAAGKGLHARSEYRDCKHCHIDHQGRGFELIFWGDAGRGRFDHALTGFTLRGRHARLTCDECHQRRQRHSPAQLATVGAGARTMLALENGCTGCHADVHRGQFPGRDCASCHSQDAWKPTVGFDHARAAFHLDGRHASVPCDRCHPNEPLENGKTTRRFKSIPFADCSNCHKDPHTGRFGSTCAGCHGPESWHPRQMTGFDHDRTAYPLRGRHRGLACETCHRAGRGYKLAHGQCADCHADPHFGQLASRADQGRCESCHTVNGFVPAGYGPEEHAQSGYPLAGAHLAVPCDACHKRVASATLARSQPNPAALAQPKAATAMRLRFASTRCADCHADRHAGEVERYVKAGGCEVCHVVTSWREIRFDHAQTRLALDGAHAQLACARCHTPLEAGTPRRRPRLKGLETTCQGCHRDPHEGQLNRPGLASPCVRCHTTTDWKPTRFDHARDATYKLDGAHVHLACSACHPRETRAGGVTLVRYQPIAKTCKACHGAKPMAAPKRTP